MGMGKYRSTLVEPKKKVARSSNPNSYTHSASHTAIEDGPSVRPDMQFSPECFTNESF